MKIILSVSILLLSFTGCNRPHSEVMPPNLEDIPNLTVYSSEEKAQFKIELNQIEIFEESDEHLFGRITDIAVDDSGRVYISEIAQDRVAIHAFNNDGSYLSAIGNYGEGPGEFRSVFSPEIYDNYLYVLDVNQFKINVYSLQSYVIDHSILLDPQNWKGIEELNSASLYDFVVIDSDRILLTFLKSEGRKDLLYRYIMNRSGEIISDNILEQIAAKHFEHPGDKGIFFSPFSGYGLLTISGNENFYTIWTEDIFIKQHAIDGEYQRSFYHQFPNKKLSRNEVLDYYDDQDYKSAVRNTGYPETWPAIHSVVMDKNDNFWISTINDSISDYEWWVLSNEGKIQAKFNWPKSSSIKVVKERSLYALETEGETGIQRVIKYSFELRED